MWRTSRVGVFLSVLLVLLLYFFTFRSSIPPTTIEDKIVSRSVDFGQIRCCDKSLDYRIEPRASHWVLYNYVPARRTFACHESVTFATHAEFTYLENVLPLVERWQAPISVALYAPGTDFATALASINYLRECGSPLVAEYVTFHLYFDRQHLPKSIPRPQDALNSTVNCTFPAPWHNVNKSNTYRSRTSLFYPINVGRNVARDASQTHYMLVADIELYPSRGLVSDFLKMVRTYEHEGPKVFPLCLFEIESNARIPSTKEELVNLLENGTAILFHKLYCLACHYVPKLEEWIKAPLQSGIKVFHIAQRRSVWEPIFISTNDIPYYDEDLPWEGKREKMPQSYALCVMDYEFHILDGAFLVHRPGIKTVSNSATKNASAEAETRIIIEKYIRPAIDMLYGTREGCLL